MYNFQVNVAQKICSSIDEFAINVKDHHIHPTKIQPGAFNSYYSLVDASDFTLMIRQVEYQYCEAGDFKEGSHGCAFLSSNGSIIYNNRKYKQGEKLVTAEQEMDSILSTNLRMVTCFIDDQKMQQYFIPEELEQFYSAKKYINNKSRRVKCDNSMGVFINDLVLNLNRKSLIISNDVIYADLCADIYLKMFNFVTDTQENECINIKPKHRLDTLKKALIYIHDNDNQPLLVSDIAQHLHTSQRNLQKLFAQYLSTSPKNYLIGRRLNKLHNQLLQADPSSNVKDIAESHGVVHLGNFAKEYYLFFGEYPKDTLRRHKPT